MIMHRTQLRQSIFITVFTVHPAAAWQEIQTYPLSYHQTTAASFLGLRDSSTHPPHSTIRNSFWCSIMGQQLAFCCAILCYRLTNNSIFKVKYYSVNKGLSLLCLISLIYNIVHYGAFLIYGQFLLLGPLLPIRVQQKLESTLSIMQYS